MTPQVLYVAKLLTKYSIFNILYKCVTMSNITQLSGLKLTQLNKRLGNTKRPCDCNVLCLHLKSSLCSCPHSILDMTSFSSADSMHSASMQVDAITE